VKTIRCPKIRVGGKDQSKASERNEESDKYCVDDGKNYEDSAMSSAETYLSETDEDVEYVGVVV
jgi:hypothetical protein